MEFWIVSTVRTKVTLNVATSVSNSIFNSWNEKVISCELAAMVWTGSVCSIVVTMTEIWKWFWKYSMVWIHFVSCLPNYYRSCQYIYWLNFRNFEYALLSGLSGIYQKRAGLSYYTTWDWKFSKYLRFNATFRTKAWTEKYCLVALKTYEIIITNKHEIRSPL